ncbi:cholera toxin secretion EpsM protein [Hyphomicrobium denitrificans 1NES1]|uniref:Cholera toxin secretion EpsM protein n=1 Tax=Hyphomicrobium denitrificans 1NES1 TaxID=670307 RepID=N0B285_9HYPH|nr:O-antigen ligase family protein [Hyphomicrobium denitrificans]AGK57599.1 cholera toxin secretion EpsM protein [Hyphomicrobium denitrificans 1NES1]
MTNILYIAALAIFLTRSSLDNVLEIVQINVGAGNTFTPGAAVNALLIAITTVLALCHPDRVSWRVQTGWIVFLVFCTIMSLRTPDPIGVARLMLVLFSYQCAFMLPFFFIRTVHGVKPFINIILYSSIVPSLVAAAQILGALPSNIDGRIASTFTHPNIFAFYLLVVGAAIAYRFASPAFHDSTPKRVVLIAYSGLLCVFLLTTQTRSAWFAATLLLFSYAVFIRPQALLSLVALPFVVLLSPSIQERLLNIMEPAEYVGNGVILNSYDWRRRLWHDAFTWIDQSPLAGHGGLGSFFTQSPNFFTLETVSVYAHNVFIQLAFEVGYIGAALFFVIFAQKAWTFISMFKIDRPASVIGITYCAAYLAVSYSDNMLYYLASNWYAFAFLGALIASGRSYAASEDLRFRRSLFPRSKKYRSQVARVSGWSASGQNTANARPAG